MEKAFEIFSEQKDLYGLLIDFSRKKGCLPKVYEIFGSEMPLGPKADEEVSLSLSFDSVR